MNLDQDVGGYLAALFRQSGALDVKGLVEKRYIRLARDSAGFTLPFRVNFKALNDETVLFGQVDEYGKITGFARRIGTS